MTSALAAGKDTVTLALRMSGDRQQDPAYGRHYSNEMHMTVTHNRAPNQPTNVSVGGRNCVDAPFHSASRAPDLVATVTDPDVSPGGAPDSVGAKFEIFDVSDPSLRFAQTSSRISWNPHAVRMPEGFLADGHTYDLTVRGDDGEALGPKTAPCRFTSDFTRPEAEPTIASPEYPEQPDWPGTGGPGVTGHFTFGAGGTADIAGYRWGERGAYTYVAADRLGGGATVDFTPTRSGPTSIVAAAVDRAGNQSPTRRYEIWVRSDAPEVTATPPDGALGQPVEFTFTSRVAGVVEYSYEFNQGVARTVAAGPDRTAKVTLVLDQPYQNVLTVRSRTAAGTLSDSRQWYLSVDGHEPTVTSADYPEDFEGHGGPGVAGTFEFISTLPRTAEYVYSLDGGPQVVVPAGPDGRASTSIAPADSGWHQLSVRARRADGITSAPRDHTFLVNE